jgi:hypothetical protein
MTVTQRAKTDEGRDALGRFAAGNPGKPRGATHRINRDALQGIGDLVPSALTVLRDQLSAGNFRAAAFVLQRYLPDARVIEMSMDSDALADAAADGLTPAEMSKLVASLKALRETEDLASIRSAMDDLEALVLKTRVRS